MRWRKETKKQKPPPYTTAKATAILPNCACFVLTRPPARKPRRGLKRGASKARPHPTRPNSRAFQVTLPVWPSLKRGRSRPPRLLLPPARTGSSRPRGGSRGQPPPHTPFGAAGEGRLSQRRQGEALKGRPPKGSPAIISPPPSPAAPARAFPARETHRRWARADTASSWPWRSPGGAAAASASGKRRRPALREKWGGRSSRGVAFVA